MVNRCTTTGFGVHPVRRCGRHDVMADYVSIETAAQHLDTRPRTIEPMIAAGTLTGIVDWEQVESKLLPARRPRS